MMQIFRSTLLLYLILIFCQFNQSLFSQGNCSTTTLLPAKVLSVSEVSKNGILGINSISRNPYDFKDILINQFTYIVKQDNGNDVSFTESSFLLGFYGFDYSSVKNIRYLSLPVSELEAPLFYLFLHHLSLRSKGTLNYNSIDKLQLVCVGDDKRKDIMSDLGLDQDPKVASIPLYIIWDKASEPDLPGEIEAGSEITPMKEISELAGKNIAKPVSSMAVLKEGAYYVPPDVDPSLLPRLMEFITKRSGHNLSRDLSTKVIHLAKDNSNIQVEDAANEAGKPIIYPLPLRTVNITLEQPVNERRGDNTDPELKQMKTKILKSIDFFWNRQKLFLDSNYNLMVPEIADLNNEISLKSTPGNFHLNGFEVRRSESGSEPELFINLSVKKSSIVFSLSDSRTNQPIKNATIFIDYKQQIYTGKINSGDSLVNVLYNNSSIRYRFDINHPDYLELKDSKIIKSQDFVNGLKLKMDPRPGVNLFYFDKELEVPDLPEFIRRQVKSKVKTGDGFIVYIRKENNPIIIKDESVLNSGLLNSVYYIQPAAEQTDIEMKNILAAISLDSIPETSVLNMYFYYNALNYIETDGKLTESIYTELVSGIKKLETRMYISYSGNIPEDKKNIKFKYLKIQP